MGAVVFSGGRVFKDNVSRLYTAAKWALEEDAVLVVLEGWRVQELACGSGRVERKLTGAEMSGRILRLLLRRGLLDVCPPLLLKNITRCTAEEVDVACGMEDLALVGAVGGRSCPSVARAKKYYQILGVRVLLRAGDESGYYHPSRVDAFLDGLLERVNWAVHCVSFGGDLGGRMEVRLARWLRRAV